ncbi:hypothetical protein HG15A2_42930 [Adhaeretor mobilis]|uniref:Aldose 1-epimerase n=1 Tax=Adhaeretor mobilis TaxID=1930276 RepID=A0A517N1D6_9BACT|nr:hypothetical protein HG15A2_42930 [Adhaeretor mobilis]
MTLSAQAGEIAVKAFDSIRLYTLESASGRKVEITNYGATSASIIVPDRDGAFTDVALGHSRVEDYINAVDKPYFINHPGALKSERRESRLEMKIESPIPGFNIHGQLRLLIVFGW